MEWKSEAVQGLFMVPMTNKEGFDYSETFAVFLVPFFLPVNLWWSFPQKEQSPQPPHLYRLC